MFSSTKGLTILLSVISLNLMLLVKAQDLTGLSVVMGKKQYYIDSLQVGNFYEGVHFCAQYDMKLASIENKDEYNRLYTVLKTNDIIGKEYWLSGYSYETNNALVWLGIGKPISYWGEGGTSQNPSSNQCLYTAASTFAFTAGACTGSSYGFICEKPVEPNCGKYGQCRYTYSYSSN